MRSLLLFVILSLQGFIGQCYSAEPILRALIVADTLTECTRESLQFDVWRMEKSLDAISQQIGYPLERHTLVDENFTIENVKNWLHSLPKKTNDILLFYYTGHGCGDALKKPWPVLSFTPTPPYKPLGGSAVVKYLKQVQSKLTIILFDCCNCKPYNRNHVTSLKGEEAVITDTSDLPGLQTLFCHTSGLIIAAAAARREPASAGNIDEIPIGSTFSIGFIRALSKCCGSPKVRWKTIFRETKKYCIQETKDEGPFHPIFSIRALTLDPATEAFLAELAESG